MLNKYKLSKIVLVFSFLVFSLSGFAYQEDYGEARQFQSNTYESKHDFGGAAELDPPTDNPPTFDDDPVDDDNPPTFDDDPVEGLPIDNYLLPLALGGIILSGYAFARRRKSHEMPQ